MNTTIHTPNGDYDITSMNNYYTVQLNGDEVVYPTELEAKKDIWKEVFTTLWNNPPQKRKMYNNNDIQCILDYITEDNNRKQLFFIVLPNTKDGSDIKNIINSGYYEDFDKYDSDVCEQFLKCFEQLFDIDECIVRLIDLGKI